MRSPKRDSCRSGAPRASIGNISRRSPKMWVMPLKPNLERKVSIQDLARNVTDGTVEPNANGPITCFAVGVEYWLAAGRRPVCRACEIRPIEVDESRSSKTIPAHPSCGHNQQRLPALHHLFCSCQTRLKSAASATMGLHIGSEPSQSGNAYHHGKVSFLQCPT
jgi:hypothetical protein